MILPLSLICIGLMFVEVLLTFLVTRHGWGEEGNSVMKRITTHPVLMLVIGQVSILMVILPSYYIDDVGLMFISILSGALLQRVVLNTYVSVHGYRRKKRKRGR
jgi:hypothetical protein